MKQEIISRRIYTLFLEVDGASGSSPVTANCKSDAKSYFDFNFGRFGYKLVRIE